MTTRPLLSAVFIVFNDLDILSVCLPQLTSWVDEIVILDLGSDDGLEEYCKKTLRPCDKYLRRDKNTAIIDGFDEARNAAAKVATGEWIIGYDADWYPDLSTVGEFRKFLKDVPDGINVCTIHLRSLPDHALAKFHTVPEYIEATKAQAIKGTSHKVYRNNGKVEWRGYIHESFIDIETDKPPKTTLSPLSLYHLQFLKGHGHLRKKFCAYHWMLWRAKFVEPRLQAYTATYWYNEHFDKVGVENVKKYAEEYEQKYAKACGQHKS